MTKHVDNMIVSSFQILTYVLIYHAIAMLPSYLSLDRTSVVSTMWSEHSNNHKIPI